MRSLRLQQTIWKKKVARIQPRAINLHPVELKPAFDRHVKSLGFVPDSALIMQRRPKIVKALAEFGAAVHLLPGNSKSESTVSYLGIEADDALEISQQTEI